MTVNISKPAINVREKLNELDKPTGIAGEAMLRAETPQEQFNLIGAGRRNLIINGDMRIDQRNSGSSITGHAKYGVDRFLTQSSNTSIVSQRVSDAPDGFHWSLKLTNGGTDNLGSSYREVRYVVEGYDISAWDKNNQSLTLSFWVKSSLAGTYQGHVRTDSGTDYFFGFSFDLAADTWTKVERVIPPNPNSTLSSDNLAGMSIFIVPHYGTTYTSSASGSWEASYLNVLSDFSQNWANTSNATFQITGVQLELGKVATPFEHRSYGEELALCQRYYYQVGKSNGDTLSNFGFSRGGGYLSYVYATIPRPVFMRATPTVSGGGNLRGTTFSGGYGTKSVSVTTSNLLGFDNANAASSVSGVRLEFDSDWTTGDEVIISDHDGTGFISFDAEL